MPNTSGNPVLGRMAVPAVAKPVLVIEKSELWPMMNAPFGFLLSLS
ncbi:hypothetical protein [Furfurilactobacillus siliginis]|nr:hypothetical protein [Furfurilactobacillus siliginis]